MIQSARAEGDERANHVGSNVEVFELPAVLDSIAR